MTSPTVRNVENICPYVLLIFWHALSNNAPYRNKYGKYLDQFMVRVTVSIS